MTEFSTVSHFINIALPYITCRKESEKITQMSLSAKDWTRLIIFIILTPISIYMIHQTYLSYLEVQRLEGVVEQAKIAESQARHEIEVAERELNWDIKRSSGWPNN